MVRAYAKLVILASLCACTASTASDSAICVGTRAARADHAAALAASGDDRVVVTGARLVGLIDAVCRK